MVHNKRQPKRMVGDWDVGLKWACILVGIVTVIFVGAQLPTSEMRWSLGLGAFYLAAGAYMA